MRENFKFHGDIFIWRNLFLFVDEEEEDQFINLYAFSLPYCLSQWEEEEGVDKNRSWWKRENEQEKLMIF